MPAQMSPTNGAIPAKPRRLKNSLCGRAKIGFAQANFKQGVSR
jgi:hypothetical protein